MLCWAHSTKLGGRWRTQCRLWISEVGVSSSRKAPPARLRKLIHKAIEDKLESQFLEELVKEGSGTDQVFAGPGSGD